MNTNNNEFATKYSIAGMVRNFINKMRQNPDIYPIRYYKKSRRFRRNWHTPIVK
jgi:hypothetical protein